jgi:DNA-binding transcriptional ArsR family regulator
MPEQLAPQATQEVQHPVTAVEQEPDRKLDGDSDAVATAERVKRGAELRLQRMSWQAIADELGYADRGAAYNAVMGHLRRLRDENLADLRDQESEAYDRAAVAIWPKVLAGDARAQDTWLRNRQRFARLHGLDAPVQVSVSAGAVADVEDALAELEELYQGRQPQTVAGQLVSSRDADPDEEERHG